MSDLLKDSYNKKYIQKLSESISTHYPSFDNSKFIKSIFDNTWESLELKERMRHISKTLGKFLPQDYKKSIEILIKAAKGFGGFEGMFFPDFIEVYGMEKKNEKVSLKALKYFTTQSSSEFAIRQFLLRDQKNIVELLVKWSCDKNYHVRRLASEGCRPRLPWAVQLPSLVNDPRPIFPILKNLYNDEELYVRRSVANNINDISKDHPDLALKMVKSFEVKSPEVEWVKKHALRTLLKKGDKRALSLFGFKKIKTDKCSIKCAKAVKNGESIEFIFNFDLEKSSLVRVEYAIYFLRKNGNLGKKVFKISERKFDKGPHKISKSHSFKKITTRVYYPGVQKVSLILNGEEASIKSFNLL